MTVGHSRALICLFLVSVLWGFTYPVSAILLKGFSPVFLSSARICFTALFLISVAVIHKGIRMPTKSEWGLLVGAGIFGTLVNNIFYFTGLYHTTPANASLIIALAPIATILLERIIYKEKLTVKKSTGAVISLVGVFSIIGIANGSFGVSIGDLNILVSMLSLSIGLLFIRKLSKTMNSYTITIFATILGSMLLMPAAGVEGLVTGIMISDSIFMWLLLIASGVVAIGIGGFLWNKGVVEVGAGTASMFMNIQPFTAIVASHLMLGDPILINQIIGGILVLLGVFIANMPSAKREVVVKPGESTLASPE